MRTAADMALPPGEVLSSVESRDRRQGRSPIFSGLTPMLRRFRPPAARSTAATRPGKPPRRLWRKGGLRTGRTRLITFAFEKFRGFTEKVCKKLDGTVASGEKMLRAQRRFLTSFGIAIVLHQPKGRYSSMTPRTWDGAGKVGIRRLPPGRCRTARATASGSVI